MGAEPIIEQTRAALAHVQFKDATSPGAPLRMMLNLDHQSFGRYALGEDETIICSLKAVLACGLIPTVILGLRGFVAGEFQDDDAFLGAFQDFLTTMNGKKRGRVLLKTCWAIFLYSSSWAGLRVFSRVITT
jgi:hypothetical protein